MIPGRRGQGDAALRASDTGSLAGYMEDARQLVTAEIERLYGPDAHNDSHLYELILDYPLREGKALRPTLAIALCRALGGYLEAVLPTAATLELYHNAFLIHDDIEDDSLMRRGRPTLHLDHGVPIAVNVGDAMLVLSLGPLLDNIEVVGLGPALKILDAVAHMCRESVEGQAMELEWVKENRWDVSDDDYRSMVVKKTGWYSFITPLQVGALVAGAPPDRVRELEGFGRNLSIAFQITDDLLNLRTDVAAYGKEVGGDLWEGKRTLMLLAAVRSASAEDRRRAVEILGKPRPSAADGALGHDLVVEELLQEGLISSEGALRLRALQPETKSLEEVAWLQDLIERQGAIPHAREIARAHALDAEAQLSSLDWLPDNRHSAMLFQLVHFVHERVQ